MDDRQATLSRAAALDEAGSLDDAAAAYRTLLAEDPDDAALLCRLGALELKRRRAAESAALLERAAAVRPDVPEVHNHLGMAYKALQRWGDASRAFEHALRIDAGFAASYFHLAEMAMSLGQPDAAVALYRQSIGLSPEVVEPHLALGNWAGAVQCFRAALAIDDRLDASTRLEAQSRLGVALLRQELLDDAAAVFLEMLSVAPHLAEIHSNLAFVYDRQGKLDEAVAAGRRAIERNPLLPDGHNNLGVALRSAHRLAEAEAAFAHAVRLKPDFALAKFNRGSVQLMREDYAAGWEAYESRTALFSGPPRTFGVPRWFGRTLNGGALLLHAEQGFGDTLQFIRFAKLARERSGALVVAEVPPALVSLMSRVEGIDVAVPTGHALPPVVAEVPIPSLPHILQIDRSQIPTECPYVQADPEKVREWKDHLSQLAREPAALNVGIVWQGNAGQSQNVHRSCPLAQFARLRDLPGIAWFSLQKDVAHPLDDASGLGLAPLGHLFADFSDTAAAATALDLVITVDTSVAHLCGALGLPAWTLLMHTPDWRWQLDRSDSPWYPTLRLFRQPRWGDWPGVFKQLHAALQGLPRRSAD